MAAIPSHRRIRLAALAILVAGWSVAAAIYVSTLSASGDGAQADAVEQQREQRDLARMGGTAMVRTAEFDAWLSSLWHGRRLACTLAVLSFVVAGCCWRISELMAEDVA